jgi:HPt (histidine-containing phosphotransfer) domain-containing protein
MAYGPAMTRAAVERDPPCVDDTPAFDAVDFDELAEAIGDDGVKEMVAIFEAETRLRLNRLAAGDQSQQTQLREMHTLKGAAGSVAARHLAGIGMRLEQAVHDGIAPTRHDRDMIEAALEIYLRAVREHIAVLAMD